MSKCQTCKRLLDDPTDPIASHNCGGDCRMCMAGFGDPDEIFKLVEAGLLDKKYLDEYPRRDYLNE